MLEIHATFSSAVSRPSATSGISIPTLVSPNPPLVLPVLKRTIMSPVNADLRAGDPEVRPAFGRCMLSLNSGMAALDDQFAGKVLMVTAGVKTGGSWVGGCRCQNRQISGRGPKLCV